MRTLYILLAAITLSGCATGTGGVVEIGSNTYMLGGLGGMTDYSGSAVKARFFKDAAKYCADKGMAMTPLSSTGQDSTFGNYASAEVQFRCIPKK